MQEFKQGSDIKAISLIGGANIKKQQEKLKTPEYRGGDTGSRTRVNQNQETENA